MTDKSSLTKIEVSRSIYYSLTDDVPGLTEEEKVKLESVMKKAQEFEEAEEACRLRLPIEGQLFKYTNVMKGWQYRWFVLTPDTGMFEYYMLDERKKIRPRGALHLAGAVIMMSEEDKLAFSVSGVCGEVYKLKASDTENRQFWIERIKYVIENCLAEDQVVSLKIDSPTSVSQPAFALCKSGSTFHVTSEVPPVQLAISQIIGDISAKPIESPVDCITHIKESIAKASECQKVFAKSVESLPFSGTSIKCSDRRLLLIKATSQATVQSLEECYFILRKHTQRGILSPTGA